MLIMPYKYQPRRRRVLLAILLSPGLLSPVGAVAQIDRGSEGSDFDLRLRQYQSDRQWRSADPLTRQRREATDLRQRLETRSADRRRDPLPMTGGLDRERDALDFDLDLERGREGLPPPIEQPPVDRPTVDRALRRDLDQR